MNEITVSATLENLKMVQDFIGVYLSAHNCPKKIANQVFVAVEEIYTNIAKYAYSPNIGEATISCSVGGDPVEIMIRFLDQGKPFDPLNKKDPDVSLSIDERDIGGLGILMVKKTMDDVEYKYKDGCNMLTLKKSL